MPPTSAAWSWFSAACATSGIDTEVGAFVGAESKKAADGHFFYDELGFRLESVCHPEHSSCICVKGLALGRVIN